jgi:hypothetical protein
LFSCQSRVHGSKFKVPGHEKKQSNLRTVNSEL